MPGEVIIRESEDSSYIYKANLKVMLEEDYLKSPGRQVTKSPENGSGYLFQDPRMKELNKYSTQLIRELILPKLTQEINTSKKYAQLRQVFFSLILSRWFKDKFRGKPGQYSNLIDSHNLDNLTSKEPWSKDHYFNEYKKSFQQGEYNLKEQITTPTGQLIRSYVSGGTDMTGSSKPLIEGGFKAGSPLLTKIKDSFKNKGLPVLFFGGISLFIYGLVEVTMRVGNESDRLHRVYDIKSDLEIILNGLIEKAQKEERYKDLTVYLDLKYKFFPNLYSMSPKKMIEALDNAIEVYKEDKNLVGVLEKFRDLLQKAAGSSPLTQKDARDEVKAQFDLLNRDPRYKDLSEWKKIYKNCFYYADFKIDETKYLDALNTMITRLTNDVNAIKDTAFKNAAQVLVDKFKALSKAAALELGVADASSAVVLEDEFKKVNDYAFNKFKSLEESLMLPKKRHSA